MIRWNWNPDPSRIVLMDLETQSAVNLKTAGTAAYLADPDTRLMSGVFLIDSAIHVWVPPGRSPAGWDCDASHLWPVGYDREAYRLETWAGEAPPPAVLAAIADGYTFVAHNASGFDALAWARLVNAPSPEWCDTLPSARCAGLPAGLDALGMRFTGRGKDEGKDALKLLYTAKRGKSGGVIYPVGTLPLWRSVLRYNVADVLLLERIWRHVGDYGEADVLEAHSAIDARGVLVDRELLLALRDLWAQLQASAVERVEELSEGELGEVNIRSVPQVKAWLRRLGLHVDSLNRKELERLYADPLDFFGEVPEGTDLSSVVEVLRARQTATRISGAKIDRLLSIVAAEPDGRARNMLVIYGAHTWRWSGRGFQPHNLARGVGDLDVEGAIEAYRRGALSLDWLREAVAKCKPVAGLAPTVDDALSTLLRPAIVAAPGNTLAIVDYASVEARGIAWIAGQDDLLELFRNNVDVYCEMATRIFGRPITKADKDERQIGKVVVLGCGYGMGAEKFGLYCALQRIDLASAGTSAAECVKAYRAAWPKIAGRAGVWRSLDRAARSAVEARRDGTPYRAGRCTFRRVEGRLECELASGRCLTYRDARIEMAIPGWARSLDLAQQRPLPTLVYTHPHGYAGTLYGGLLAENVVQATCRDLLATALVRCHDEGIPVVLHVHDEIVGEVPIERERESLEQLARIMSDPPEWATGFPIGVEGFTCPRYVKSPWRGAWTVEGMNGTVHLKQKG